MALVFQQAAVLRNNIDQKVVHLHGSLGTDMWSRQTWEQIFSKNMVIVCTAEIVYQCLLNSHIKMDQINLLIFDEAHHTKKDHPYARFVCPPNSYALYLMVIQNNQGLLPQGRAIESSQDIRDDSLSY